MNLIEQDLNKMAAESPSGYFEHVKRSPKSDSELLKAINKLGLNFDQAFDWLKSEKAKDFLDTSRLFMREFARQIAKDVGIMKVSSFLMKHNVQVCEGKINKKDLIKTLQILNIHGKHFISSNKQTNLTKGQAEHLLRNTRGIDIEDGGLNKVTVKEAMESLEIADNSVSAMQGNNLLFTLVNDEGNIVKFEK